MAYVSSAMSDMGGHGGGGGGAAAAAAADAAADADEEEAAAAAAAAARAHVLPQPHDGTLEMEGVRMCAWRRLRARAGGVCDRAHARPPPSARRIYSQTLVAQLGDGDAAQRGAQRRQRARQHLVGVLDAAAGAAQQRELRRHGLTARQAALSRADGLGAAVRAHNMSTRKECRGVLAADAA